jgi:predicted permease
MFTSGYRLMSLVGAFTSAVLPILVIAAVGSLLGYAMDVDVEPVNTVGLYVFLPVLAFHSVATSTLGGRAALRLGVGVVGFTLLMLGLAWAAGRLLGEEEPLSSALLLSAAFPNVGFVGIPLSEFAFGEVGRTVAVLFTVYESFLIYTIGAYVASRGSGRAVRGAVTEVFKLPLVYGVVAAVAAQLLDVVPPADGTVMTTVEMVGDAAIPLMLLVLGLQLAETRPTAVRRTVPPSVLKLVVAPVVGAGVALALAFPDPTVARVFVLECATPTAIIPLALVIEYTDVGGVDELTAPEYITTVVLVTTLASSVVLTVLVAALQAGWFP